MQNSAWHLGAENEVWAYIGASVPYEIQNVRDRLGHMEAPHDPGSLRQADCQLNDSCT